MLGFCVQSLDNNHTHTMVLPVAVLYTTAMASIDVAMMVLLKLARTSMFSLPVRQWVLPFTMILYSLEPYLFSRTMAFEGMGLINALWDSTSTVLIAMIGVMAFGEKINRIQWIGIGVCVIGLLLMGVEECAD